MKQPPPRGFGLDVGSTTAKLVVANDGAVVHHAYRRHHGRCLEVARALVCTAEQLLEHGGGPVARVVTGSVGASLSGALGASYVHEVPAVAAAVRARHPAARTVIELGGQDAKMLHLEPSDAGSFASDMNERCAAGTGATLDRCLRRLGLGLDALSELVLEDGDLPVISARCGVFAEADVVAALKAGVPLARVLSALLDSVVRGNLAVLAKGRPLRPGVVLLGGPHAFIPALAELWRRHLPARWREAALPHAGPTEVVVPPDAALFAAEGALRSAEGLSRIAGARGGSCPTLGARPPVCQGGGPDTAPLLWRARRSVGLAKVGQREREDAGPLSLGVDAGSTTIKAVALDEDANVCARAYRRASANPMEDGKAILAELASALGGSAPPVTSLGVTGYAADVLGPVLGADATPVETLAHARAARRYVPDADVVCDVGGQDIKVLLLDHGGVRSFFLSSQCAAGNGALLESTAAELGIALEDYAELALRARRGPALSLGCAVFLDTQRVTAQRDGFTPEEILAAMAAVVPRNVWENVVAAPSLPALGRVFVLSGGVQRNRAAREAQIAYLEERHPGVRVVVHPFPGEAGAIGAALAGREACEGRATRFAGFARAAATQFVARRDESTRCRLCPSGCGRTLVEVPSTGERLVTGSGCERGSMEPGATAIARRDETARDLLRVEARRLFASCRTPAVSSAGAGLRVAVPRVLAMYRSAPLFLTYFRALGAAVSTGPFTSEALWQRAAGRGTVDACFPAKVVQAHVAELLSRRSERPFDVLWLPVMTHAVTAVRGCADTAACPAVAGTPMVTRAVFGGARGGWLATPTLSLARPELFSDQLFDATRALLPGLGRAEHDLALSRARARQGAFEASMEVDGAAALEAAAERRKAAVLVLGRPYHVDPGLHHELGSELRARDRTTLSLRALPKSGRLFDTLGVSLDLAAETPRLSNSGDGEKLAALHYLPALPYLVAIEISSFKCGQDASLYGAVSDAATHGGRPFLPLHDLDETRPVASLRLRIRTFLDAVERYERRLERGLA